MVKFRINQTLCTGEDRKPRLLGDKSVYLFVRFTIVFCTAIGNLDHGLNQDCVILTISLKGVSDDKTKTKKLHPRVSGPKLFLRHLAAKVHKRSCVGNPTTSAKTNSQSGSSSWSKMRKPLFASTDKQSDEATERIARLEQLVGRLTVVLDIRKNLGETPKQKHLLELTPSEQRCLVEALRTKHSVRQICDTLLM